MFTSYFSVSHNYSPPLLPRTNGMYNGVDSCSIIGESSFGVLYSCLPQWMGETVWRCQIIALILVGRMATNTFNIDEDGMYHNCSAE